MGDLAALKESKNIVAGYSTCAFCSLCERQLAFEAPDDYAFCRDGLRSIECDYGGCVTRERAVAHVVLGLYGKAHLSDLVIHEAAPCARGLSLWMMRNCSGYIFSGYFPDQVWGDKVGAYRNENLEAQTFADQTFDLVIHLDVLEHVFHPFVALSEIYRTLKPGGRCIMTAPTYPERLTSEQVAFLENGEVRVIGDPEYHGNPQNPVARSLVTWRYGYDLPLLISRQTAFGVEVRRWHTPALAIQGRMTEVYILSKE